MINTVDDLKNEFELLLKNLKGKPTAQFMTMAEIAIEAVICARAINEYALVYGRPVSITNPAHFLNQKPGKFDSSKAFKVKFRSVTFYFATDVECYGLSALQANAPVGDIFESDIVVINESHIAEIANLFGGRPAPQHLNAAYECKFGVYHKSQLRELLGFRRHVSYLNVPSVNNHPHGFPFGLAVNNSNPDVQVILFRPINLSFLKPETAELYNLYQKIHP